MVNLIQLFVSKILTYKRHALPLRILREPIERWIVNRGMQDTKLTRVDVQTTTECNLACPWCPKSGHAGKKPIRTMDIDLYKSIVKQLVDMNFNGSFIPFMMAEPLCDSRIVELVQIAATSLPKAKIVITTNGRLLTWPVYYAIMQCPNVVMTIDDYSTDHRVIRLVEGWHTPEDMACRTTLYDRSKGPLSRINIVGYLHSKFTLPLRQGCKLPFHQLAVRFDGKALRCCTDWEGQGIYGDLTIDSIKDVRLRQIQIRDELLNSHRTGMCVRCDYMGAL